MPNLSWSVDVSFSKRAQFRRNKKRYQEEPQHVTEGCDRGLTRWFYTFKQELYPTVPPLLSQHSQFSETLSYRPRTTDIGGFSQSGVKPEVESGNLPDEIDGKERGRELWVWHSYLTCPLGTWVGACRCSDECVCVSWSYYDLSNSLC